MVSSLGREEPVVNAGDVLRVEVALMVLCQVTHVNRGVVLSREIALGSQLVEVDLHVVLEKPGFFETAATDLAAVLKRVLVFPHVTLQKPGLAEGLAAHLAGEFTNGLLLVAGPHRGLLPRA